MPGFLSPRVTGLLGAAWALAYLLVGWWPLTPAPRNLAVWRADGAGLTFHPPSVAFSAGPLLAPSVAEPIGFTLEILLSTNIVRSSLQHVVTLHGGELPSRFAVCQWKSELLLRVPSPAHPRGFQEVGFRVPSRQTCLVTIVCTPSETLVALNGRPHRRFHRFVVPPAALRGRVVLGDAAEGKHSWSGTLLGLGAVGRRFGEADIARRHQAWLTRDWSALVRDPELLAVFPLHESREAATVADPSDPSRRIVIPSRYSVLRRTAFALPGELRVLWTTEKRDVVLNLFGFIPIGFLAARFLLLRGGRGAGASVGLGVAVAAVLSLTIETGQIWLPTRVSSATDLAFNVLGGVGGACLAWRFHRVRTRSAGGPTRG